MIAIKLFKNYILTLIAFIQLEPIIYELGKSDECNGT